MVEALSTLQMDQAPKALMEAVREGHTETVEWLLGEMRVAGGAFAASYDADSEGEEGKFYVWQADEVRDLLTAEEYAVFAPRFGLDGPANFEGSWHLRVTAPIESLAERTGQSPAAVQRLLDTACAKLLEARAGLRAYI